MKSKTLGALLVLVPMAKRQDTAGAGFWIMSAALAVAGCSAPDLPQEPIGRQSQAITVSVRSPKNITATLNGGAVPFHWENVSLAVPPNRSACGSTGAAFFKPAGNSAASDGYTLKQVWKTSLSCLRGAGTTCPATVAVVGNPAGDTTFHEETYTRGSPRRQQLLYVGGNDARFARLKDDTLLLESQGFATTSGGYEPRGVQAFYASSDCGSTWSLRSVADPKYDFAGGSYHNRSAMNGLDFPFLHVDPWRGTVYVIVGGTGDVYSHSLLLVSKDNALTWTLVTDPATGLSPIPRWGQRITTLASGEVVIFGCESEVPTLRIYNPATNQVNLAGTLGELCSRVTGTQIGATNGLRDGNLGITRTFNGSAQQVRVMYPTVQNNRQRVAIVDVTISNGSIGGAGAATYITPASATGSIVHATMVEPDYVDVSTSASTNPGLIYWLETTQTNPLWGSSAKPWAKVYNTDGQANYQLDGAFDRLVEQGDYLGGSFYFDSATHQVGFVAPFMPDNYAESPVQNLDTLRASAVEWSEPTLTNCPTPVGVSNTCSSVCRCLEGQSDCTGAGCAPGLVCGVGLGANYGYAAAADVCVPAACNPNPHVPGDSNYCSTTCRCAAGKGDCDGDGECLPGLVCGRNNGAGFGLSSGSDVCVPSHCTDFVQNGDETTADRGGSCGNPSCPLPLYNGAPIVGATCRGNLNEGSCEQDQDCKPQFRCLNSVCLCRDASANGSPDFCGSSCPCSEGQGLCKLNSDCASGLVCAGSLAPGAEDVAGLYGMASKAHDAPFAPDLVPRKDLKVCLPSTCATQRATPGPMSTPGDADFCTTQCRCARGFGNCTSDSECLPGLTCLLGLGPNFGLGAETSVCAPVHCANDVKDADETFKDCGGRDCGTCDQPVSRWVGAIAQPRPLTLFRRTTGEWPEGAWVAANSLVKPSNANRFSNPVYGDFNGDLTLDRGYYHYGTSFFYYSGSATQSTGTPVLTPSGYVPTVGRYNAGNSFEVAWWKTSNTTFYAYDATTGTNALPQPSGYNWGLPGDIPVPGDYDGDGRFDYAIFRPSTGEWWVNNTDGVTVWNAQPWGMQSDIPLPGDYNGDGKSDLAVYRPGGTFLLLWKVGSTVTTAAITYGQAADIPVAGNFGGDGKSDLCVFRPGNAQWFCRDVTDGAWGGWITWGEARPLWPPQ